MPNGDLASGSYDTTIKVWNLANQTEKFTLKGHSDGVLALSMLDNGFLASSSADSTINIWNLTNGMVLNTLAGHIGRVYSLALLKNGYLASGGDDSVINIWNTSTGLIVKALTRHELSILGLLVLQNGNLVSVSLDKTLKVWNSDNGTVIKEFKNDLYDGVFNMKLLLDNNLAFSFISNNEIRILNSTNGVFERNITNTEYYGPISVLSNGLLGSVSPWLITIWNTTDGKVNKTINITSSASSALVMTTLTNDDIAYGLINDVYIWSYF